MSGIFRIKGRFNDNLKKSKYCNFFQFKTLLLFINYIITCPTLKKRVGNLSHLTPMTSLQNPIAAPIVLDNLHGVPPNTTEERRIEIRL